MLKVKNLNKNFTESNHHVLKDISMTVGKGEFVCILGPSGCGKTIFLYLLAGFLKSSSGSIKIDEKSIEKPSTDRILIFQDYVLFPWKTVFENILFGLEKSELSLKEKNKLAAKYIDLVGLKEYKNWYPHKLSGGMKQRVAIARALISEPKLLLMDEPFSALDPQYRKYMRKNLEEIWQKTKKTVVFVTHSVNEALYLADTIYLFSSLPAKIKKTYKIDMPRPRDLHSDKFVEIAKDIEKEMAEEFQKSLKQSPAVDESLKKILEDII